MTLSLRLFRMAGALARLAPARHIRRALIAAYLLMFVGTATAFAVDGKPSPVTGFGAILPLPDLTGGGPKTMFETYSNPLIWFLDTELDYTNPVENFMAGINDFLMLLVTIVVFAAIGLTYWLFNLVSFNTLNSSVTSLMTGMNTELMNWLAPTSLAIGAVLAYAMHKRDNGGFTQVSWLFLSAFLGIGLTVAPGMIVNSVDQVRTFGSDAIVSAGAAGIGANNTEPFSWPEVQFNGTPRDNLLRKTGDAIWRTQVATPWCVAEFGSMEACKAYAKPLLDLGMDREERKKYIKKTIYGAEGEGSKEAPVSQWVKGQQWYQRLPIVLLTLVIAVVFTLLLMTLCFAGLVAVITTLFLLIVGVFFALIWCIPGMPRQWGVMWFNNFVGALVSSFITTTVFVAVLALQTAAFNSMASAGWAPTVLLGLAIMAVAFIFRRTLGNMIQLAHPGAGGMGALGYMALKGLSSALFKKRRVSLDPLGGRPTPRPRQLPSTNGRFEDMGERNPSRQRFQFRELPAGPSGTRSMPSLDPAPRPGNSPRALPAGPGNGTRRHNVAFESPRAANDAYPMPHATPGRRPVSTRPATAPPHAINRIPAKVSPSKPGTKPIEGRVIEAPTQPRSPQPRSQERRPQRPKQRVSNFREYPGPKKQTPLKPTPTTARRRKDDRNNA